MTREEFAELIADMTAEELIQLYEVLKKMLEARKQKGA